MDIVEKRKYPRVNINNLVSSTCLDNEGGPIKNLMGIALDISQGGIQLETLQRIGPGNVILTTADEQDKIIEINGKAVYCCEAGTGKYHIGISFQSTNDAIIQFVKSMVRAHHYRKASK